MLFPPSSWFSFLCRVAMALGDATVLLGHLSGMQLKYHKPNMNKKRFVLGEKNLRYDGTQKLVCRYEARVHFLAS